MNDPTKHALSSFLGSSSLVTDVICHVTLLRQGHVTKNLGTKEVSLPSLWSVEFRSSNGIYIVLIPRDQVSTFSLLIA